MNNKLKIHTDEKLVHMYAGILGELRNRGIIRSYNAIPGDLGERFAAYKLGLTLVANSVKGYDAQDASGTRYQIKTRRVTARNKSRQLGGFRDLHQELFDYCIVVILGEDFTPEELWKVPHHIITKYARDTTRGFKRVVFSGSILQEPQVEQLAI